MTERLGLVTDSSSQITDDLIERFDDGGRAAHDHHRRGRPPRRAADPDRLDADGFYAHFDGGAHARTIATSQPSPGRFVEAYERLTERGCTGIVSVHIAEAMSGTVGSASLAARSVSVPVEVIDTGSASYGVALCAWAAGAAIDEGADAAEVRRRIDELVPEIGTAFMVGVPFLTERSGRADGVDLDDEEGIPVLAMRGGDLQVLDRVSTVEDTIDVMAGYATAGGVGATVAIGTADEPSRPLTARLEEALTGLDAVDRVMHYRIGPSVGAHTGPGTFGLFVFPTF